MKAMVMEILEPDRIERVRKKLDEIFDTLVKEYGMEPNEVGALMQRAGNTVAGDDGGVYLAEVMREIEERIGQSLFENP